MDREDFREYVSRFNANDFEGFGAYYATDVEFNLGDRKRIDGRENVLAFYRQVAERVRETIEIEAVIIEGNRIAAELYTEFYALEDWPDFIAGAMEAGDSIELVSFVHYLVEDGKFSTIKSARYRTL